MRRRNAALASVRLGLESIIDGNERALRSMLMRAHQMTYEKIIDVMGVSNINAEMLCYSPADAGRICCASR